MKKQGMGGSEIDPGTSDMMMSAKKAEKKVAPPKATPSSYPEMKPAASVKKADFKATIEKVQKQLDKINKMDPTAKAKVTCEMAGRLGPILGTEIVKDPKEELKAKEVEQDIQMSPVDQMRKSWEGSIDILKAEMETWMPGLAKATGHERGINKPASARNPKSVSEAGKHTRVVTSEKRWASSGQASMPKIHQTIAREHKAKAKGYHKEVLSEMRSMPKPKLD